MVMACGACLGLAPGRLNTPNSIQSTDPGLQGMTWLPPFLLELSMILL